MIYTASALYDDICGKEIIDLGCGCGMLSIAASIMDAKTVYGFDIDPDALYICKQNLINLGIIDHQSDTNSVSENENDNKINIDDNEHGVDSDLDVASSTSPTCSNGKVNSKEGNICDDDDDACSYLSEIDHFRPLDNPVRIFEENVLDVASLREKLVNAKVETVIMNPPFGTKNNAGIDVAFIETALKLAKSHPIKAIYSMHKTTTRPFLERKAKEVWRCDSTIIAEMKYDLPAQYNFHKKEKVTIAVDLIRFGLGHETGI